MVVTVPDWIATRMSREIRVLVLRSMDPVEARERVKTRERAMRISAIGLEISQTLDNSQWG